jgi:hypothetical protein
VVTPAVAGRENLKCNLEVSHCFRVCVCCLNTTYSAHFVPAYVYMIGSYSSNSFIIGIKREVNCWFGVNNRGIVIVLEKLRYFNRTPSETWVQSQASPYGIFGGRNGTGTSVSSSAGVFLCQKHSTFAPCSLIQPSATLHDLNNSQHR